MLHAATQGIQQHIGSLIAASPIYETEPWGLTEQPAFYNQVLCVATTLPPLQILQHCQQIELALGRQRKDFWGARTIDIDILGIDNLILRSHSLEIPHPWLAHRRFVLVPLCDIAPTWLHPTTLKTASQLLLECKDEGKVLIVD